MFERLEQLKSLIQSGQIDRAIEMVQDVKDHRDSELFVFTVLNEENSTPELVEATLEAFLGTRKNRSPEHGYWVHSLSHLTKTLWKRRMDSWIKKLYEVALKGANELQNYNCCDRLAIDFAYYSEFDDDPADFALTPENLCRIDWKYATYAKARIEAGRFESEEAFLCWKLRQPETHIVFDCDTQTDLVNLDGIRSLIQRLQELGIDTSEFNGLEKNLLVKRLNELEKELLVTTKDWQRERLKKAIQKTREALAYQA